MNMMRCIFLAYADVKSYTLSLSHVFSTDCTYSITVKSEGIMHLREIQIIFVLGWGQEWSWLLNRVLIEQKHFYRLSHDIESM